MTPSIPRAVLRNTWLLFLAQAMVSIGMSTSAQLGSLIVYRLSGTAALAGLPSAIFYGAMAAIGYPAGRLMDRRGRRPGLMLGFLLAASGAVAVGTAVSVGWFAFYLLGVLIFSAGVGIGMLARAAVADMYPSAYRAGAVGRVVAGGLVGGIIGPTLVTVGAGAAPSLDASPLAVPWVFVLVAAAVAAVAASRLRPDPREVGQRLHEYFPGADEPHPDGAEIETGSRRSVAEIIRGRPAQAAMAALACAQATMVMLMATASLMLSLHGHDMGTISLVLMAHITGMFALSVPIGRLADRLGRRPVLVGGALLCATSGLLFPLGVHSVPWAAAAFFLVGVGWCLAFVAGAALLGDLSDATTRARVVGINDLLTNLSAMAAALLGGVLLARGGGVLVGILAALLGSLPLVAIARAGRAMPPAPVPVPAEGGK